MGSNSTIFNQYKTKTRTGIRTGTGIRTSDWDSDWDSSSWQEELADELHKPIKRNFTRRRIQVYGIDKIWASDLVELHQFKKWNNGYKYLPMVIDVFSKYGWIEPLKDKKVKPSLKHSKRFSKKVENHNIYGLIRVKNFIINIRKSYWKNIK